MWMERSESWFRGKSIAVSWQSISIILFLFLSLSFLSLLFLFFCQILSVGSCRHRKRIRKRDSAYKIIVVKFLKFGIEKTHRMNNNTSSGAIFLSLSYFHCWGTIFFIAEAVKEKLDKIPWFHGYVPATFRTIPTTGYMYRSQVQVCYWTQ